MVLCCVGDYCGYSNCRCSAMIPCFLFRLFCLRQQYVIVQMYCVVLELIVVTATVDIVQWYCVVLEFIVDTAKGYIECNGTVFLWSLLWLQKRVHIVQLYCVVLEFIVVSATVDIVQWCCVVYGVHCGNSNIRYSAMLLC